MDNSSRVQLLQLHPDTRLEVQKELNLDQPGRIEDAVVLLENWIQKQAHFVRKDFSRSYLEHVLIVSKGSVERSKEKIDKICTFKTMSPQFFDVTDIKTELAPFFKKVIFSVMPKLNENHERIVVYQLMTVEFDTEAVYLCAKLCTVVGEYLKKNDYTKGMILVADYRPVKNLLALLTKFNVAVFCDLFKIFTDIYGFRLKKIFFLSESKVAEKFLSIFKQLLPQKIADRIIIIHSHTNLAEHLSGNTIKLLPEDYGGLEKPLKDLTNDWLDVLSSPENMVYYNEMKQFKTDEAYRQTDKFNEAYMGMPGSFRALSVD